MPEARCSPEAKKLPASISTSLQNSLRPQTPVQANASDNLKVDGEQGASATPFLDPEALATHLAKCRMGVVCGRDSRGCQYYP